MSITLDQVTKRYQGSTVVNDVSLDIGDGEFFVLLGPSGSGKSTLLRAIAGLTGVDHGRIALHGRDVTHLAARKRGVGLVFQNYALFRHMTVGDNIEFALRVRRMRASKRRARRQELLRLVALEGLDSRLPAELSGGQQQRVAVARALAHNPEVLLLDEPFGALDAKIREELRRTIRQVQRELGITTVLVTHDQEEAFALADRIGIMHLGRLLEVGRPDDLYARPATRFVATFLGAANLLLVHEGANGLQFGTRSAIVPEARDTPARAREVVAVLRPEEIEITAHRADLTTPYLADGVVHEILFSGALERLRVRLDEAFSGAHIAQSADGADTPYLEATRTQHEQRVLPLAPSARVVLGVRRLHVLPTPLSSFTVCAPTEELALDLKREPLIAELAEHMRTRIAVRVEPIGDVSVEPTARFGGAAVIAARPQSGRSVAWLLERGAEEVLILPRGARAPQSVIVHSTAQSARRATLAVAASMLRHLPAEAVYIGIMPTHAAAGALRAAGTRALLDTRSEAHAAHGLDVRTELRFGDATSELAHRLAESPDPLLVLGIEDIANLDRFAALLDAPRWPLLIVYQPAPAGTSGEAAGMEANLARFA